MQIQYKAYKFDLSKPLDISIPLQNDGGNPKAFYAPNFNFSPVKTDEFIGSTTDGGILNFKNIIINPHGNGTHTECLGHITENNFTINKCLKYFHFLCQVVSIKPEKQSNGDLVITEKQINNIVFKKDVTAITIRTTPNNSTKKTKDWSGTNHPFIDHKAMKVLVEKGIEHFLIDSPSVDKENDEGKLLAHKTYWNLLNSKTEKKGAVLIDDENDLDRKHCTITEMIFVPNHIEDGLYLMNIMIMPIEMDASPSKILLYKFY